MTASPGFSLWLEFEHTERPGDDPTDDFANVQVRLSDGRRYALNVWTFKFFRRARAPWPYGNAEEPPEDEYLVAPDLFVERLERSTLDRVVSALLTRGEMKPEWLCPDDTGAADDPP